jgi:hypothetical protein
MSGVEPMRAGRVEPGLVWLGLISIEQLCQALRVRRNWID